MKAVISFLLFHTSHFKFAAPGRVCIAGRTWFFLGFFVPLPLSTWNALRVPPRDDQPAVSVSVGSLRERTNAAADARPLLRRAVVPPCISLSFYVLRRNGRVPSVAVPPECLLPVALVHFTLLPPLLTLSLSFSSGLCRSLRHFCSSRVLPVPILHRTVADSHIALL